MAEKEEILGIDLDAAIELQEGQCVGPRVRRIEVTCRLHTAERISIMSRLAALEKQSSLSSDHPEIKTLKNKLQSLGEVPTRAKLSKDEARAIRKNAKNCALAGNVSYGQSTDPSTNAL